MPTNPVLALAQSRQVTLAEARALEENPPVGMSDTMKRRLASFVSRYESVLRTHQRQNYDNGLSQSKEVKTELERRLDAAEGEVAEVQSAVRAGRMTAREGETTLKRVFLLIKDDRAALDALDMSSARAIQMISTDPAAWQAETIQRFPLLARSVPMLSVAYLTGEDTTDPLEL